MWRRLTWEQFARGTKFFVGLTWGTLELALWGGRLGPLAFIGAVIAGTEGGLLYRKVKELTR